MPTLRICINLALYHIGLADTLPVEIIRAVPIQDNGEPLRDLKAVTTILTSEQVAKSFHARESVCSLLEKAASKLPVGYRLLVVEAYRSPERQRLLWDEAVKLIAAEHPKLSTSEIERRARRFVAQPSARIGGHQTGGALDVTLADEQGRELFLGTGVQEFSRLARTSARRITKEAREYRHMLYQAMHSAGFVNYPAEWWHFCYGDQLWAAYSGNPMAIFGAATTFSSSISSAD